ncbi:hypothetical protein BC830DRAFT_81546 [Chytriomyces sp. MP71]|nr:hypothetical protein BC830DRAFT_81546 [Chytriomyces sp. MP71]
MLWKHAIFWKSDVKTSTRAHARKSPSSFKSDRTRGNLVYCSYIFIPFSIPKRDSLLIDDVAELRNTTEIKTNKLKALLQENQDLKVAVEKFKRESYARQEFQHLISEIESKGENYLHLMRNMKSYLRRPREGRRGTNEEVDEMMGGGDEGSHD